MPAATSPEPQTVDPRAYSNALERLDNGVWSSGTGVELSYPEDGNEQCLAVEEGSFWFLHRNAVIVDTLHRHPPPGPLFDVGAGNGFVSMAIHEAGLPVVVIEPGPRGSANARARGLDPVIQASLEGAGFAPGSLPAIAFFDVVEHVEDDLGLLTLATALLEPGGRTYLTVPAHRWLWSEDDERAGHFRRYDRQSLTRLLAKAGLTVEWVSHFFVPLPPPILLSRVWLARFRQEGWSATRAVAQHDVRSSRLSPLLAWALALERRWLDRDRALPFGSSLIAVARRSGGEAAGNRPNVR